MTLKFDLTQDCDLIGFMIKFWNGCISGIVGLIDVKWKESKSIGHWAYYLIMAFDHTHDLGLELLGSKFEIAYLENERAINMEWMKVM